MTLLIVIPCLNEEAHLPGLLAMLADDPATHDARIVIADGGSTDKSRDITRARAESDQRFVLLDNPKRLQNAGVNLAARAYGGDCTLMLRVDAHAHYPPRFVADLIAAQAESGVDSVTVSMRARSHNGACFQIATAEAQNSVLGTGGSAHRAGGARRFVDHGHHALFTLAAFRAVGGYDENFSHNEDAELDARLIAQGARILLAADILIDYFPRNAPSALARQYYNYGRGRARTMAKHHMRFKPRQMAPLAVAPAALLALLAPWTLWAALPFAAWLTLCLGFGAWLGARAHSLCAAASGIPAATMHLAWSFGYWRQIIFNAVQARKRAHNPRTSAPESV